VKKMIRRSLAPLIDRLQPPVDLPIVSECR
jgi:hypothetical protein